LISFEFYILYLNSIFADYSGDWFISFVGDDVVAECISKLYYVLKKAQI